MPPVAYKEYLIHDYYNCINLLYCSFFVKLNLILEFLCYQIF